MMFKFSPLYFIYDYSGQQCYVKHITSIFFFFFFKKKGSQPPEGVGKMQKNKNFLF